MKRTISTIAWSAVVVGLLGLSNCSQAPAAAPESPGVGGAVEVLRPGDVRDSWDVFLLQGARVGYGHTTVRDVGSGRVVLCTENVSHFAIRRDADTSRQEIRAVSLETPDGQLLKFQADIHMGPTPIRMTGQVSGNRLDIETVGTAAAPVHTSIAWSADDRGPFAMEQSLLRKPMKPGERRKIKMLAVEFQQVTELEMTAKDYEPCKLRTGLHNLLRIEAVTRFANNQKIEQTVWTDRTGDVLKTLTPMLGGLETYRASKAEALQKADATFNLFPSMMVKVERPLANAYWTKEVRYRVHLDGERSGGRFRGRSDAGDQVDRREHGRDHGLCDSAGPGGRQSQRAARSAHGRRLAAEPMGSEQRSADRGRRGKGRRRRERPLAGGGGARAVRQPRGDEQEFQPDVRFGGRGGAVARGGLHRALGFLDGVCRARGIPARAAFGLVYLASQQAFFYHMWTEVYIAKRWIPIDATLAQGGIGAAHLKIAQSNLKDATAISAFLPVAQILGRLSITIVSAK